MLLLLVRPLSVDKINYPFKINTLESSKVCSEPTIRQLDKLVKLVDKAASYPQIELSTVLPPAYQLSSMALLHRA